MDYDPPALSLESLTLTNLARRNHDNYPRAGPIGGPAGLDGLPGAAMTWLLQAASGQPSSTGLPELRYVLHEADQGTRLSGDAIAAIAQHAPAVERAELWLTPENVNNDLQASST